jgi:hypothetical protein
MPSESSDRLIDGNRQAAMDNQSSGPSGFAETVGDVPAFLVHKFGSRPNEYPHSTLGRTLASWVKRGGDVWRGHLRQEWEEIRHLKGNAERGLLWLLCFLAILGCMGSIAGLVWTKSLESKLATMQRELAATKEHITKLNLIEKTREASAEAGNQKIPASRESPTQEAPLLLSPEEIQLVRDYIKPAPVAGSLSATINIGDPITGPTIPFPSPITEKIPKLLGAEFSIQNGKIVIVRRGSRHADAVLGPN